MKKKLFAATLAVLFTANVQAAFNFTPKANNKVGLYLGGQIWQSEAIGSFGEQNTLIDFNLKKEQQFNYFIAIEHPFPLLPNVRISSTTLDSKGNTTLTQAFSFSDETFPIDDNVDASFNVSYIDYTLYYKLFDNGLFSFDLGLTGRGFNGDITVTGPTGDVSCNNPSPENSSCPSASSTYTPTGKIKTDEIEPMFYVAANISLSLTGLSVFGQGDFSLMDKHTLSDYQVGLNYDLVDNRKVDFNLTLGYRAVKVEFEDLNNLYTNLEFKGAFVGVIAHF